MTLAGDRSVNILHRLLIGSDFFVISLGRSTQEGAISIRRRSNPEIKGFDCDGGLSLLNRKPGSGPSAQIV
jgi:hypothetical protein